MTVHNIKSNEAFKETIQTTPLVLVDFFATWCVPCKTLAPIIAEHSNEEKYQNIRFTKVDVDELPELTEEMEVRAMPTVMLFKDGKKFDSALSPTPSGLVELLEKGSA